MSFSRLGVVYVPRSCVPPSSAFRTWLDGPELGTLLSGTGVSLTNKLKTRLSELAKKLMWPTLAYMAGRGDAVFREEVVTLQVGVEKAICHDCDHSFIFDPYSISKRNGG